MLLHVDVSKEAPEAFSYHMMYEVAAHVAEEPCRAVVMYCRSLNYCQPTLWS